METLRRKSKWRSKNKMGRVQRCAASLAWEAQTRQANRDEAAAQLDREIDAELAEPPLVPMGKSCKPLRLRITVEVLEPNGARWRHSFTSVYESVFSAWSVPACRIVAGIRGLMANAPKIARAA